MEERFVKLQENLIFDTERGRVLRTPLLLVDPESFLIIDIVDDYVTQLIKDANIKNCICIKYELNNKDSDLIVNNLNSYDYLMKTQNFEAVKSYMQKVLKINPEDTEDGE